MSSPTLSPPEIAALAGDEAAPDLPRLEREAGALEQAGRWEEAEAAYARLFDAALAARDVELVPDAIRGIARSLQCQGRHEEAEEAGLLSWRLAECQGNLRAAARAMNLLATIHHSAERLETAAPLYRAALECAQACRDEELIGLVCANLGVLANIRGDLRGARSLYLESIASAVRSGDRAAAVRAYNNLGIVSADLREWMESELYFARGVEIAQDLGHRPLLAHLFLSRAEPLVHLGEREEALGALARAERLAQEVDDAEILSSVARYRGWIARTDGDLDEAERLLEEALSIAAEHALVLPRAEALREMAKLRRAEGRTRDAVLAVLEARDAFLSLAAARDARKLEEVLVQWVEEGARQ